MDEISVADARTMFQGTLCMHKGVPVKCLRISDDLNATILILAFGKKSVVKFSLKDFKPVTGRIGFVNHGHLVFYVSRVARRQWVAGITQGNTQIRRVYVPTNLPYAAITNQVTTFEQSAWHNAVMNIYPSFKEAMSLAIEHGGAYAFDRQFAVDHQKNLWYKHEHVGRIPTKGRLSSVVFNEGYEYLELPLVNQYEKTIRVFGNR